MVETPKTLRDEVIFPVPQQLDRGPGSLAALSRPSWEAPVEVTLVGVNSDLGCCLFCPQDYDVDEDDMIKQVLQRSIIDQ